MKLKKLMGLDAKEVYSKISANLPEGQEFTAEMADALEDSAFVGKGKLLPADTLEHIDAVEKVLSELEDSADKTELLSFLASRKITLTGVSTDSAEGENTQTEQPEGTQEGSDSAEPPATEPVAEAKGKDYVSYSFGIRAEGGPWQSPEDCDPETEKAILELLLSMYANMPAGENSMPGDSMAMKYINQILGLAGDNKQSLINELCKDTMEENAELKDRLDAYKKESEVVNKTIASITCELKDTYVSKLVSMQTKEDPAKTKEQLKDELSKQPLEALRYTIKNIDTILGKGADSFTPAQVQDTTENFADTSAAGASSVTEQDIADLKVQMDRTYADLNKRSSRQARAYKDSMTRKIASLEKELAAKKNSETENK